MKYNEHTPKLKQTEKDVYLENQLRDTDKDWFYRAFCVENAAGKEITFHMQPNPYRILYSFKDVTKIVTETE